MSELGGGPVAMRADTVIAAEGTLTPGWVQVHGSRIEAVGKGAPPSGVQMVDLGECTLAPGFIDVHVHGAVGAQVNGTDAMEVAADVRRIAAFHARHGTTALLATTVSDSMDVLLETLRGIALLAVGRDGTRRGEVTSDAEGEEPGSVGATVLGAHLEGPWLSPSRAGAQDPRHLHSPSLAELETVLGAASGTLRMVTLAPELPSAIQVITALVSAGVVASLGHTDADLATAQSAFDAGARHVTHLFNAMPGLHHRDPGPVGAALADSRTTVEVVADRVHLDPVVLGLVLRAAPGRVIAVTDATPATGLGPGRYALGDQDVVVSGGRVVLADAPDRLAGSMLTMDRAVANLVTAGASVSDAVAAASATPARLLGDRGRGVIRAGARADLAVLDARLCCAGTLIGGSVAFDRDGLLAGFPVEIVTDWPVCRVQ